MTTPTNPPAGDMTAPSEGRRTRLGEVIYGAMFEVQIDLRYGGAEKAEYIADAVRRALEEAEPGDHPDSEGDNVPSLDAITRDPAVQDAVLAALVEGGRLVEELELSHCPWLRCERDLSGECLDEACRVVTRRKVRLVEPEWREATNE